MSKENALKDLFHLLKNSLLIDEGGYLVATLTNEELYVSDQHVESLLNNCEYKRHDKCISSQNNQKKLYIERSSDGWNDQQSPLYLTHRDFWQLNKSAVKLPNFFFIQEDGSSNFDSPVPDKIASYLAFFAWKNLLKILSDHSQVNKSIVFITNDKSVKKLEITTSISSDELHKLPTPDVYFDIAQKLRATLELNDPHEKDRLSVMRATLSEVMDSIDYDKEIFIELMKKSIKFSQKYDELYDIYTRRFSINKLLNELDEKSLEYTSKINEFISSSQTKAYALPGALIAVGALAKTGGSKLDAIIILGGLWMIKSITYKTNQIYRESFDSLNNRITKAFKKYLKFEEGKEVKDSAKEIEKDLKDKIITAKNRLDSIDKIAYYMFVIGIIYLFLKWLSA